MHVYRNQWGPRTELSDKQSDNFWWQTPGVSALWCISLWCLRYGEYWNLDSWYIEMTRQVKANKSTESSADIGSVSQGMHHLNQEFLWYSRQATLSRSLSLSLPFILFYLSMPFSRFLFSLFRHLLPLFPSPPHYFLLLSLHGVQPSPLEEQPFSLFRFNLISIFTIQSTNLATRPSSA